MPSALAENPSQTRQTLYLSRIVSFNLTSGNSDRTLRTTASCPARSSQRLNKRRRTPSRVRAMRSDWWRASKRARRRGGRLFVPCRVGRFHEPIGSGRIRILGDLVLRSRAQHRVSTDGRSHHVAHGRPSRRIAARCSSSGRGGCDVNLIRTLETQRRAIFALRRDRPSHTLRADSEAAVRDGRLTC
jgi:hypothetical protein